ncbi:hypothetical protein, partial [Mesorhizobium sp.]|uniref:hypothetical protein n=1 Tax=Mesorhizobium sp. TaxID=1871066 RepID=UPI0025B96D7A
WLGLRQPVPDGLNLDSPLAAFLRRRDHHGGDAQLLICLRHHQQTDRAEPLGNLTEQFRLQIKKATGGL